MSKKSAIQHVVDITRIVLEWTGAFFVGMLGLLIAIFAISIPTLDVVPQALSLIRTGWPPIMAWSFSIATSAMPMIHSFTKDKMPIKARGRWQIGNILYHTFFILMRVGDAFLDVAGLGVLFGITHEPSLVYLVRANTYQVITALMMFLLSNVTDELKTAIVWALAGFNEFVTQITKGIAHGRSNAPRSGTQPKRTNTRQQWQHQRRSPSDDLTRAQRAAQKYLHGIDDAMPL